METNVLHYISYGVYVIASVKDGLFNGQIANSLVQVATRPAPVLAVSINKKNLTHEYIAKSGVFSVSVLERDTPLRLIGKFGFKSGRVEQKFKDTKHEVLPSGCPVVLENALCYLDTKVTNSVDCGEYTLFLAEVAEMKLLKNGEVLTYAYYHEVKSGTTPDTAPTFIEGEARKRDADLYPKYRCTVCSYVYNPTVGDPDGGIPPGTPFEKIPFDWTCPICGVGKNKFEKMETSCESV